MTFAGEMAGAMIFPAMIVIMSCIVNAIEKKETVIATPDATRKSLTDLLGREGIVGDFYYDTNMNLILTASGEKYRFETDETGTPTMIVDPFTGEKLDKRVRNEGIREMTHYYSEKLSDELPKLMAEIERVAQEKGRAEFSTLPFNNGRPLENVELMGLCNAFRNEGFEVLSASQPSRTMAVRKEVLA